MSTQYEAETEPEKKTVVHFGGGALGRGLVIPTLIGSNCDVILVDTAEPLIERLEADGWAYALDVTDAQERIQKMQLAGVINSITESDRLEQALRSCDVVTTAVRRENLRFVAPAIAQAWKDADIAAQDEPEAGGARHKAVICCENVEGVGSFFRDLLLGQQGLTPEQVERLGKVSVPDTVVDRICASDPDLNVSSETFFELGVDEATMPESPVSLIGAERDIPSCFARKRYLMNTYADLCSFIGVSQGLSYLYEAVRSDAINAQIEPYVRLLVENLQAEYGIPVEELERWRSIYRTRLSNERIPRDLATVARDLWRKLTPGERFVSPVLQAMSHGIDPSPAFPVFEQLLASDASVSEDEAMARLKDSWSISPLGQELYQAFSSWRENKTA